MRIDALYDKIIEDAPTWSAEFAEVGLLPHLTLTMRRVMLGWLRGTWVG